jgi:signal transduction histidine kinase
MAGTAAITLGTAALVWPLAPLLLSLPNPGQLKAANAHLHSEVAERRRVEAELREFQAQLEQRVAERTAALEQAHEALQNEVAERVRLDRFKDELVATVGHELRTPLTSIGGSLHLLAGSAETSREEQRELASIAMRNTERLIRLVNTLLDADRLEKGHGELRKEVLSMAGLVRMAIQDNEGFARQHGVSLALVEADQPALVQGDADRLLQVLTNLISNAVKHAPRGSAVELDVRQKRGQVRVRVTDRGPGVPDEHRARLFDKFVRVRPGDASATDGFGLGLSIARAIVVRHRGSIGLEEGDGPGTTFFVELLSATTATDTPSTPLGQAGAR